MIRILIALSFSVFLWFEAFAQNRYSLVEISAYASCADYKLTDSSGADVAVPATVSEGLQCPSLLSLSGDTLCYRAGNYIRVYHIPAAKDYNLFEVFDDIDGVSGPVWSPSRKRIAFVIINQERKHDYSDMCRILILDLDESFNVVRKYKFDRPVNFTCGSICASDPVEDFRFIDENNIEYTRNLNIEDRPGEKGYIFIESAE
ncbi:hypothetical protein SDC9_110812 [bioreactor metagenome]|uniref:Protein TolB n=1 Tax=bioreactor metagenome TaxID=1076179 RepID=A0A645BF17_9ZZZZ